MATTTTARRWATSTLRDVAARLEAAPDGTVVAALTRMAGHIEGLDREARLMLPRRRPWWTRLRRTGR